jgi:hypothetical protein
MKIAPEAFSCGPGEDWHTEIRQENDSDDHAITCDNIATFLPPDYYPTRITD